MGKRIWAVVVIVSSATAPVLSSSFLIVMLVKYLGGKCRIAKHIGTFLNQQIRENKPTAFIEPFCGSCWITKEISPAIPRHCSDAHEDLVLMWKSLQNGWT